MTSNKHLYWHFAASCCLVLFVILGYLAKFYESTLLIVDHPLSELIRTNRSATKDFVFTTLTKLADPRTVGLFLLLFVLFCWRRKYFAEAYWVLINVALVAGLGNYFIKFAFKRPRPNLEQLVTETHFSFPSGHAMVSMLFLGSLILILPLIMNSNPLCLISQVSLGLLILLIGLSRIYLGVHYPTDILGGYLLGGAWLLGTYPTFSTQRFIWRFKGKQH